MIEDVIYLCFRYCLGPFSQNKYKKSSDKWKDVRSNAFVKPVKSKRDYFRESVSIGHITLASITET